MLKDALGIDLNLLLEEIRQLRIQLVRTIENNNSLRAKLEEQLARSPRQPGASSNINIHHLYAAPGKGIIVICDVNLTRGKELLCVFFKQV